VATTTRVTQVPVEIIQSSETAVRVTQVPVELITQAFTPVRVSQVPIELITQAFTPTRVTQMVVEIIRGPRQATVTNLDVACFAQLVTITGDGFQAGATIDLSLEGVPLAFTLNSLSDTTIVLDLTAEGVDGTYCVTVTNIDAPPSATVCVEVACGCPPVTDPDPDPPPPPAVCPVVTDL